MNIRTLKSDALLLVTAMIWGFAFVAQRVGMEYVEPFTFNAVRFALGSLSLLPLLYIRRKLQKAGKVKLFLTKPKILMPGGGLAGFALYMGASLQQVGIVYTTAGKAGFITSLYVVIVPILGLFWKQRPDIGTWIGAILAAVGMYFLSITAQFTIAFGDLLVLISALFWAVHVHTIGWLSPKIESLELASFQFATCSVLSFITAIVIETITLWSILQAAIPILYGGLLSVGVAYTLQVVAQRNAHPAHAAIILSLESAFAAIGGWLVLDEILSLRGLFGCVLMLAGMLLAQFNIKTETLRAFLVKDKRRKTQ